MAEAPTIPRFVLPEIPLITESDSRATVDEIRRVVDRHGIAVTRSVIDSATILRLRDYLGGIGSSSFPNWQPFEFGTPNFHRINVADSRSHVPGRFHQFNFFPWNQDVFNLFELFRPIFGTRNRILGEDFGAFLEPKQGDKATARIGIQFYPSGEGGMDIHRDPKGFHQRVLATVVMSELGRDYSSGGLVARIDGQNVFPEQDCRIGDVLWFDPQIPHGVSAIDDNTESDWLSFRGRWVALCATNSIDPSSHIGIPSKVGVP